MLPPLDSIRFARGEAMLTCSVVPWDTESFGFTVAQIDVLDVGDGTEAEALLGDFRGWCADAGVRLASCRLDHLQLRESMAIEEAGFRFVEMVYRPRLDLRDASPAPVRVIEVQPAAPSDLDAITAIAYSAFATGRYLLDWRVDPVLGKSRYAAWVRRGVDRPGHTVLKVVIDGEIAGFFLVESRPDGSVYWHLTALAPSWQGRGIGLPLWQSMVLRHRQAGMTSIETVISGHNLAALNLYARAGFSFPSAQMTFHWLESANP